MAFITGSTANTANPAKDFMETILHPNLIANGFTYVEEVVAAGTSRIYKSAAAANGVGDWYLSVYRVTDANTVVQATVSEDYDVPGHLLKKFAPYLNAHTAASQTLPADKSHYTVAGLAPSTVSGQVLTLFTSASAYIMSINAKRAVVSVKVGSTDTAWYAGLYENALIGIPTVQFPLVMSCSYNPGGAITAIAYTREPSTVTTVTPSSGNGSFVLSSNSLINMAGNGPGTLGGVPAVEVYATDPHMGLPTVSRAVLPTSQFSTKLSRRGFCYDLYAGAPNAFAYGDTVNINWGGTSVTAACVCSNSYGTRLVNQAA